MVAFLAFASAVCSALVCFSGTSTGLLHFLSFVGLFIVFFAASFVLYMLCIWVISLFIGKESEEHETPPFFRFLLVESVGVILFLLRTSVKATGLEKLPEGTFLLVGNHRSVFDPMAAIRAMRYVKLNFVSKHENFEIPVGGAFMRECGFLEIDREDDRNALKTILNVADRMKNGECSYGIYPEGTRTKTGELLPFRNGCFKAAQRAGVPIVVATVQNPEKVKKNFPWRHTEILFDVCEVLDAETVQALHTNEIGQRVRNIISQKLETVNG